MCHCPDEQAPYPVFDRQQIWSRQHDDMSSGVCVTRFVYDGVDDLILNYNNEMLFTHEVLEDFVRQGEHVAITHHGFFKAKIEQWLQTLQMLPEPQQCSFLLLPCTLCTTLYCTVTSLRHRPRLWCLQVMEFDVSCHFSKHVRMVSGNVDPTQVPSVQTRYTNASRIICLCVTPCSVCSECAYQ